MRVKLLNRIENIVAKGEIALYEQFFILSQGFKKSSVDECICRLKGLNTKKKNIEKLSKFLKICINLLLLQQCFKVNV